jgi:GNAT superfamily N-acetyltransferase
MVTFTLQLDPPREEVDAVLGVIIEHTKTNYDGPDGYQAFGLFINDPATGAVTGGATGYALLDWLFIQFFSVPEVLRGTGVGTELMNRVEAFARERGLIGMWLDTFEFQARPFYEKLGFSVFGTIEDHPIGSRRYFMSKRFVAPTA